MTETYSDTEPRVELDHFDVELKGAWLSALRDGKGRDVLLPKTMNDDGKDRGGSHVCVPYFGPDKVLGQHGFGRTLDWTVGSRGTNQVELVLDDEQIDDERYRGLYLAQQFAYDSHHTDDGLVEEFAVVLEAENTGTEPMLLAPAFHPYFLIDETTTLDGEPIDLATYGTAKFPEGSEHVLQTATHEITIKSDTMTTFAVWSGGELEQRYLCVEPTQSGASLAEGRTDEMDMLTPGQRRTYDMTISWRGID